MKKVLEDLFFGEIQPNIRNCDDNPQYRKSEQAVDTNEDLLLQILEGKERELFLSLTNAQSEVIGHNAVDNFILGFKLGARIIAESLIEMK